MLARAAAKLPGKTLVAYFSRTGNTWGDAAAQIQQITGGVRNPRNPRLPRAIPGHHRPGQGELESNFRPQLTADVATMDSTTRSLSAIPTGGAPCRRPVSPFWKSTTLARPAGANEITEGSRLGRSAADIQTTCPKATVHKGLALRGGSSGYVKTQNAQQDIAAWLRTPKPPPDREYDARQREKLLARLALDLAMLGLILLSFAYQLTGNTLHEVLGFVLFSFWGR